jgi:NADP-dependent 3-hydroxy-3-methylglutaryl-CoA reductase
VTGGGAGGHPGPIPQRGHYTEEARKRRLSWIRDASGKPLRSIELAGLDAKALTGNIENFVGTVEIPVGLAGPLLFDGQHARGWITAPLATTEGALVASCSRGARAISTHGGAVSTRVLRRRMVRAPLYVLPDLREAMRFNEFAAANMDGLREQVRAVSQRAELVSVEPIQIGRQVHLRFEYETADAAGQNMTTACTWHAARWLLDEADERAGINVETFFLDGNSSGDKKLTHLNMLATRGARVTAECWLSGQVVRDVLKTHPEDFVAGHNRAIIAGHLSSMVGYNVNVANAIAAIFTATGQDIACIHESGAGLFSLEPSGDGVYASLLLPGLAIGTVGGGTQLPNQNDYLEMIGCAGDGGADRLAEVIAGFTLALELSTCAAMIGGQFADAHERLGRNRPVDWFTRADLTPAFVQPLLRESLADPGLIVTALADRAGDYESGSVSEFTSALASQKLVGLLPLTATYIDKGSDRELNLVVKSKPLDAEVALAMNKVASLCGGEVAAAFGRWRDRVGFEGSHVRELGVYGAATGGLRAVMPRVYGMHEDPEREAYVLLLEDIRSSGVILADSADDASGWSTERIDAAIRGIAGAHAVWLGRERELLAQPWLGHVPSTESALEMTELWRAIAAYAAGMFPMWVDDGTLRDAERAIADIPSFWPELEAMPRTLVHNDFSPRNIALRASDNSLVAYDWELATLHVPQRDLAELLAFVLTPEADEATVLHHVEVHRHALQEAAGVELDGALWRRGYRLALRDFALSRIGLWLIAHAERSYPFLHRVVPTMRRLIDLELERENGAG